MRSALRFEFRHDDPSWGCFADMYFKTSKVSSEENMLVYTKKETRGVEENNTKSSLRKHPFLLALRRREVSSPVAKSERRKGCFRRLYEV